PNQKMVIRSRYSGIINALYRVVPVPRQYSYLIGYGLASCVKSCQCERSSPFNRYKRSARSWESVPRFLVPKLPFGNARPGNSVSQADKRLKSLAACETEFRGKTFPNGSLGTRSMRGERTSDQGRPASRHPVVAVALALVVG